MSERSIAVAASPDVAVSQNASLSRDHKKVIFASSLGTVFEWYDFYLYGSLAAIISKQFFSGVNETARHLCLMLSPPVSPCGPSAHCVRSLGDLVGRKYTFSHDPPHGRLDLRGRIVPSYAAIASPRRSS